MNDRSKKIILGVLVVVLVIVAVCVMVIPRERFAHLFSGTAGAPAAEAR